MREIVLDTETTGLDPQAGHRIVEIAGVELINHVATGETQQLYINPEREVPEEAYRVHGLGLDYLKTFPTFAEQAQTFLDFIQDARLVIHNAKFDLGFLNAELEWTGRPRLTNDSVDTVEMARKRFPGAQVNLDALCKRFEIDNSARDFHGALLDCQLLAEVYLELRGGRQPGLALASESGRTQGTSSGPQFVKRERTPREPRPHAPSEAEEQAHQAMLAKLSNPLWQQ
ncbi:DNA polymerase III subunit epsilon [Rhodovibrio salinarum]|uniref:DNA polymerase III subunit epsilon n=1 Tax=Rhodovibrio salinarum TaxID=1087 RepID=A0A934QH14_9PROT|nr:DNA polymerase III subunit epsilon [Rhodovibrio salinarum]MBK1696878.1 DNA polymerase III subunit epsilon [Rhodovibrio salinarum]